MALIVEDGTAKADAESYLALADATAYYAKTDTRDAARDALIATWSGATDPEREAALREATRHLDGSYFYDWRGVKSTAEQALQWPRLAVEDASGWTIAENVIPQALKDACAELALRALSAQLTPDVAAGGGFKAKSITVGSISIDKTYAEPFLSQPRLDRVDFLLRPLLLSSGSGVVPLRLG
jgi:hypothetical protein